MWIKNIGRGAALNPRITKVKLEEPFEKIGEPHFICGLLDPVAPRNEKQIPADILDALGVLKLNDLQSLGLKIEFDSPHDEKSSKDELNHSTIQEIRWASKEIKLIKNSWHADYRR